MKKALLVATMIILGILALFAEKSIIRFENPTKELVVYFNENHFDVASYKPNHYLDVVVTQTEKDDLIIAGYQFSTYQTEQDLKNNLHSRELEEYTNYQELEVILNNYELIYPDICKVYDIGDSWGKIYAESNAYYNQYDHDILALKLSDNPEIYEDEPSIYYLGAHHSREPISVEVPLYILNYLITNYGIDDQITEDINNKQIWFVPMVNPNGNKIVLDELDVWWRKNIRDNNDNGQFDTDYNSGYGDDGVDPNRNYGFEWGNTGATDQSSYTTYHGPNAFSEPEIQAVRDFILESKFVAGISYHSYSQLVLYPFGFAELTFAPDHNALSDLGISMAEMIPNINNNQHYVPSNAWELYPCMGGTDDWAYGVNSIFSYTIELADQFIPPADEIEQICEDNLDAALLLMRRSDYSTLTGLVTDSVTGLPIEAKVYIDEVDNFGSFKEPYKCDPQFGRYYRMLMDGEYNVTFSYQGYSSVTQMVTINNGQQTILDVQLQESIGSFDNVMGIYYDENIPIENATMTIEDTEYENLEANNGGFSFNLPVGIYNCVITTEDAGILTTTVSSDMEVDVTEATIFISQFEDDFEDDLSGWDNENWGITNSDSYLGTYSLTDSDGNYNNNQTNIIEIDQVFDFSETSLQDLTLSFYTKYSIEEGYDFCRIQIKEEFGEWIALDNLDGEADWHQVYYDLSYYTDKLFRIRFVMETDAGVTDDGIYIDGLHIVTCDKILTENEEESVQPTILSLSNYPNPFNPKTTIEFSLQEESDVKLEVFNIKGQKVITLANEDFVEGLHKIVWNGTDSQNNQVGSGVYFYRLKTADNIEIKKAILIK